MESPTQDRLTLVAAGSLIFRAQDLVCANRDDSRGRPTVYLTLRGIGSRELHGDEALNAWAILGCLSYRAEKNDDGTFSLREPNDR